jgi:preprotein translocase subunit SecG
MSDSAMITLVLLIICVVSFLIIGFMLKRHWNREDKTHFENINNSNYTMRHNRAASVDLMLIMLICITLMFIVSLFFTDRILPSTLSILPLFVLIAIPTILFYSNIKWKVVVSDDIIVVYLPFRKKQTFSFDEIMYAVEDIGNINALYNVFIKDMHGEPLKVFSVTKNISGYDVFMSKLNALDKIKEKNCNL